jgi:hypothetical protein
MKFEQSARQAADWLQRGLISKEEFNMLVGTAQVTLKDSVKPSESIDWKRAGLMEHNSAEAQATLYDSTRGSTATRDNLRQRQRDAQEEANRILNEILKEFNAGKPVTPFNF